MEKQQRAATTRDSEKYIVRFPDGMRDQIAEAAKAAGRSMNAEIVARLQRTLADDMPDDASLQISAEMLETMRRTATPGTPEAAFSKRLEELKRESAHQALLLLLGEMEFRRLKLERFK